MKGGRRGGGMERKGEREGKMEEVGSEIPKTQETSKSFKEHNHKQGMALV